MQRVLELPQYSASLHMQHVILWANGTVTVFGDDDEQMTQYQGRFENVQQRINDVFRGQWEYGDWNKGILSAVRYERQYSYWCKLCYCRDSNGIAGIFLDTRKN